MKRGYIPNIQVPAAKYGRRGLYTDEVRNLISQRLGKDLNTMTDEEYVDLMREFYD